MLDDLDRTIAELLSCDLPNLLLSERRADKLTTGTKVAISFDIPLETSIKQKPAINFFLYDVRENLDLRSSEWLIERQNDGTAIKKRPPARIDCSYLITAWSSSDDSQQEHHLLGEVMKVLLRHRKFPEAVLQGNLLGQEPPVRATILRPSELQSLGEFWQAMGGKPKAALHYTVTISVSVDEEQKVPLVLDKQSEFFRHI